jgi:hypothetical protein
MLRLLLKITVAWFSLSLLCGFVWALLIESALRRKARRAPTQLGTFPQTLSEKEVEALLATPAIGTPDGTSQRLRGTEAGQVKVGRPSSG